MKLTKHIETLDKKFRSGNAIPVERATIKAHEWQGLLEKAQDVDMLMSEMADVLECVANGDDVESLAELVLGKYEQHKEQNND